MAPMSSFRTHFLPLVAALGLAACAPALPNSDPAGVGFTDYDTYRAQQARREAALQGQPLATIGTISDETRPELGSEVVTELTPPLDATGIASTGDEVLVGAVPQNNPEISDENSFSAVSSEQTIESDAARLERNRQLYKVIEPGALPERPGNAGPNIVAYALATNNRRGEPLYPRGNIFNTERKYINNCASYTSPDMAQTDFLAKGGPQVDKMGIDPDGDGFACSWDPEPFRSAVAN